MNTVQLAVVNTLIANMLKLRGLTAALKSERAIENRVYFQLDVLDNAGNSVTFPELSVSSKGTLWSDAQCAGGEVKSFPTANVMPYAVSLAYADQKIAGVKAPWGKITAPQTNVTAGNSIPAITPDPFRDVPASDPAPNAQAQ